jgi:hypothetical protein
MASYAELLEKSEIQVDDIRQILQPRVDRGEVHVVRTAEGYTIYHHYRSAHNAKKLEMPVAQLRSTDNGAFEVYWRRGSGRWWLYHDGEERPFVAPFDRCMDEIMKDPWGCFWG